MTSAKLPEAGHRHGASVAGTTLHRAPWVVAAVGDPMLDAPAAGRAAAMALIADGGVITCAGRIQQVGGYQDLKSQYSGASLIDHEACILTPALVNAHAHLELSHLAGLSGQSPADADLAGWISRLIARRQAYSGAPDDILATARKALSLLHSRGVGLIADVGNSAESSRIGAGSSTQVRFFLEVLGLSAQATDAALARLEQEFVPELAAATPHAPYSTSGALIKHLKDRAAKAGTIVTIHVAESADEVEFLRTGGGRLRDFLEERGAIDGTFTPMRSSAMGAINYLESLGVLDSATLCVHAVHVSSAEIDLLAARNAKVCLCPGSNRTLGVGRAPVAEMLAKGLQPALGTDSLASNTELDLWQEMRILREEHPAIAPEAVFAMATRWGAEALGCAARWGTLAPGRAGRFLAVRYDGPGSQVFDFLTSSGEAAEPCWIS